MIQFYKPTLKRKDMDSVLQTMVNDQIGPGKISRDFVQAFCDEVKATSGAAYRTYPDCLSAALRLMGAKEGVRVAVSPLSPAIYRQVIEKLGAEMVIVDVDKETGCPNEGLVAASGAEILVLYESFGTLPARYNEQTTFPESYDYGDVKVIEDISESIGSDIKDEIRAGSVGKIVVCALEDDSVLSAAGGAIMAVRGEYVISLRGKGPSAIWGRSIPAGTPVAVRFYYPDSQLVMIEVLDRNGYSNVYMMDVNTDEFPPEFGGISQNDAFYGLFYAG